MVRSRLSELERLHVAALIPARGGSKGIPRKNLERVGGQTLIGRAVRTCLVSVASEVYVSTEDAEIAAETRAAGGAVIDRPAELATDETSTVDVLLHALQAMPQVPDVLVWLQCTAPLMSALDIDGCVRRLIETGAATCVAATPFHGFVLADSQDGRVKGVTWDSLRPPPRRQDLPRYWQVAGSVWAFVVQTFLRTHQVYGPDCVVCPVFGPVMDVDLPQDLALARLLIAEPIQYPL